MRLTGDPSSAQLGSGGQSGHRLTWMHAMSMRIGRQGEFGVWSMHRTSAMVGGSGLSVGHSIVE